jgi:feruloyl esterase
MSDYAISPFNGIAYYNSVVEKLGQTSVDSFMRFYVTTGANHLGAGVSSVDGTALPQGVDLRVRGRWFSVPFAPSDIDGAQPFIEPTHKVFWDTVHRLDG